jgi:lipopolysaccharide/colanic/teichoic acid biosynthesis glycosyltransferase
MFLVWKQDKHSPFYVAPRVGKDGKPFKMVKLRSMVINADKSGVDSTSANDQRITKVGHFIRRYKLDELTQLWNVLIGDMSLVGPRPNVQRETDLYTPLERKLLEVKPGITDFASIVFSDEGDILKDVADPDISYNQLIRPGKGYLGLFYIDNKSIWLDIRLCFYTVIAILSKEKALKGITSILQSLDANDELLVIAQRAESLRPMPPPGGSKVVTSRDGNPNI